MLKVLSLSWQAFATPTFPHQNQVKFVAIKGVCSSEGSLVLLTVCLGYDTDLVAVDSSRGFQ